MEGSPARELQASPFVEGPQLESRLQKVPPGRRPVDPAEGAARRRERAEAARPAEGRRELERVAGEEPLDARRERGGRRRPRRRCCDARYAGLRRGSNSMLSS